MCVRVCVCACACVRVCNLLRVFISGTGQGANRGSHCKYFCFLLFGLLIITAIVIYLLPSPIDPIAYKYVVMCMLIIMHMV